jgi:hypothetical protein
LVEVTIERSPAAKDRQGAARGSRARVVGTLIVLGLLGGKASAQDRVVSPPPLSAEPGGSTAAAAAPSPGLPAAGPALPPAVALAAAPVEPAPAPMMMAAPEPRPPEPEPVTKKWWFWAAVGGVAVATVTILVVASGGSEPPSTRLKNMEAFRRR